MSYIIDILFKKACFTMATKTVYDSKSQGGRYETHRKSQ